MLLMILRFSRLLEGDIRYMEIWATFRLPCFSLFTSRGSEIVRRSWTTGATLRRDTELRFTVKLYWINKFYICLFQAREARPAGHSGSAHAHRCHLNAYLKSQPPCIARSCGNQPDSSSALRVGPGIPVWWDALRYPWLFGHFTWKRIWVLHLWIDLAYKELFCHKIMILPQNFSAPRNLRILFSPSLSYGERS